MEHRLQGHQLPSSCSTTGRRSTLICSTGKFCWLNLTVSYIKKLLCDVKNLCLSHQTTWFHLCAKEIIARRREMQKQARFVTTTTWAFFTRTKIQLHCTVVLNAPTPFTVNIQAFRSETWFTRCNKCRWFAKTKTVGQATNQHFQFAFPSSVSATMEIIRFATVISAIQTDTTLNEAWIMFITGRYCPLGKWI